jgi:hypothetical protein
MARERAARFATVHDVALALEASMATSLAPAAWAPSVAPVAAVAHASTLISARVELLPAPSTQLPDPRRTWQSIAPSSMSIAAPQDSKREPTIGQTALAALAGPAVIAIGAAVMAVLLGSAHAPLTNALKARTPAASVRVATTRPVTHLTAKAAVVTPHGKAAMVVSPRCARNPRSPLCAAAVQK